MSKNKNYKEKSIMLRGKELAMVVKSYQKGDEIAAEKLRQGFFPLIYKIAHKDYVYNVFKEDAENEVWEVFYSLIKNYKSNRHEEIPGMLNMFLELKVTRKLKRFCRKFDYEIFDTEDLHTESTDTIAVLTEQLYLTESFKSLTPIEKEVIELYYVEKWSIQQIADAFWFSYNTTRRIRDRALKKLQQNLK